MSSLEKVNGYLGDIVSYDRSGKEEYEDMINHPPHYTSETGMEVIDVIEAFTINLKGIEATDTANVLKYICRWKKKNGIEDLEKALWYINHLIGYLKKREKEKVIDE